MEFRLVTIIAVLMAASLAGCVGADDTTEPSDNVPDSTDQDAPQNQTATRSTEEEIKARPNHTFDEDHPNFCDGQPTCMFDDEIYHEYTLYEVDTPKMDVIIVPSASAGNTADTEVLRLASQGWADGISELGAPWFLEGFEMNVYMAGDPSIPQDVLADPEIIVVAAEYNPVLLLGIGLAPWSFATGEPEPCRDDIPVYEYAPHYHDGMGIFAAECEEGGFTCVAANTNFLLGGPMRLYDLVAHEVGHCLGTGHVGDAGDFRAKRVPIPDIMSYQNNDTAVHCVSNMNVLSLEGIFSPLFPEQNASMHLFPGDFMPFHPSDYAQVECDNPPASLLERPLDEGIAADRLSPAFRAARA